MSIAENGFLMIKRMKIFESVFESVLKRHKFSDGTIFPNINSN
jgi:hypothetical protein